MSYEISSVRDVDVEQWSRVLAAAAEADRHAFVLLPDELSNDLKGIDVDRDGWQAVDGSRLAAVATVEVRSGTDEGRAVAMLHTVVDPADRGRGLGGQLLDRQERRAAEIVGERHPGFPVRLRAYVAEHAPSAHRLLERRGYVPARWFIELSLHLKDWEPPTPPTARAVPYRPELEDEVRAAHIAAFSDHWGSVPPDAQEWSRNYVGSPSFRPDVSRLVLGADGRVIAYALVYEYAVKEAYVAALGVRPEHQRRGLGRATLLSALVAASDAGFEKSALGVDGENVHDAARLYESLGYRADFRTAVYVRDL